MMGFVLLTFSRVENLLSHTDGLRSDFAEFIGVEVVKAIFQGHLSWRLQDDSDILVGGTLVT